MNKTYYFLFLLFTLNSNSQNFLITKKGEKIEYQKGEFVGNDLKITSNGIEKIIPSTTIDANFLSGKTISYLKPKLSSKEKGDFEFITRIIEGPIKIYYKKEFLSYGNPLGGGNGAEKNYWYLEKGNKYFNILTTTKAIIKGDPDKDIKTQMFKEILEKDTQLLSLVNDKKYKHEIEEILEIVKQYNCKYYSTETNNTSLSNKVILFREGRKQSKELVSFTINDTTYNLDRNTKIEITLPSENETIIEINNHLCELVIASDFYTKCYEISLDKKNKSSISERNGNSKYYKTRFKYYEKRAKK